MRHLRFIVFVVYLMAITAFALLNFRKTDREIEIAIEEKSFQIKRGVERSNAALKKTPPAPGGAEKEALPSTAGPRPIPYRTQSDLAGLLFDQAAHAAKVVQLLRERPRREAQLAPEVKQHTEEVRRAVLRLQKRAQESSVDVSLAAQEAEPTFKGLLEAVESALGPDHPEVASSSQNLATLYYLQERYDEAEPLYKRALDIWDRSPEPDRRSVADVLESYSMLLRKMARSDEADEMEARSVAIRKLHPPIEIPGSSELTIPGEPKAVKPA